MLSHARCHVPHLRALSAPISVLSTLALSCLCCHACDLTCFLSCMHPLYLCSDLHALMSLLSCVRCVFGSTEHSVELLPGYFNYNLAAEEKTQCRFHLHLGAICRWIPQMCNASTEPSASRCNPQKTSAALELTTDTCSIGRHWPNCI